MNFGSAAMVLGTAPVLLPSTPLPGPASLPVTQPNTAGSSVPIARTSPARPGSDPASDVPPDSLPRGAQLGAAPLIFADAGLTLIATPITLGGGGAALPGGMLLREEGRALRFTLDADVLFDFDRAELRPGALPVLRSLLEAVRERVPRASFRVEGHTDWIGSDAYNLGLSQRRAASVRAWLTREGGVPGAAVTAVGLGENRPVAPNSLPDGRDNPEGRQLNRRVEVVATPR